MIAVVCGGGTMKRFVEGECRDQSLLFPERLDDWIAEDKQAKPAGTGIT
jgi:hypothetical protein